jgi:integrase
MSRGDGLYRRGRVWWVTIRDPSGKRERRSTKTTDYDEAKRIRDQTRGAIADRRAVPLLARATFSDGCALIRADYRVKGRRSKSTLETTLKRLGEHFGADRLLASIGWSEATQYRLWRQGQGYATATINKHLAALKHLLHLAVRDGQLVAVPPIDIPDPENARQGFLEADDFAAVVEHLPAAYQAPARFAYFTGWRAHSEVLPLRWTQIDRVAGVVRLEPGTTKNGQGRTFPFDALPALAALIDELHAQAQGPRIFHDGGAPIDYHKWLDAWHDACAAAECRDRIPHDLRRTTVRNLERAGVARSVAMQLTGHKTEAVYRRYAIVSEGDLRDGVEKLSRVTPTSHSSSVHAGK